MWLRRDNIIVQRLPMTTCSLLLIVIHEYVHVSESDRQQAYPNYAMQFVPHCFGNMRHLQFYIDVFRTPQVLLCAFLHRILVEIKPVKPGFSTAPKPGFTGLKMAGLPGFSGTRVSFPNAQQAQTSAKAQNKGNQGKILVPNEFQRFLRTYTSKPFGYQSEIYQISSFF